MQETLKLRWHEIPYGIAFTAVAMPEGAEGQSLRRHFKECGFRRGQSDRDRWTASGDERAEDLFPLLILNFDIENEAMPEDVQAAFQKSQDALARSRNGDRPQADPEAMAEQESMFASFDIAALTNAP